MTTPEKKHFFISYTQADRRWAEWIGWQLEKGGYRVIIQAWDFAPGVNFLESMDEALKTAERTLLVLTPAALASKYVKKEWTAALNEARLVPVRVVDFDPDGLLGTHAYIDLVGLTEDEAKERLLLRLRTGRAKPSRAASFPGPQFPGTADDDSTPGPHAEKAGSPEAADVPDRVDNGASDKADNLERGEDPQVPGGSAGQQTTGTASPNSKRAEDDTPEPPVEPDTVSSWSAKLTSLWARHRKVWITLAIITLGGFFWYQVDVYGRVSNAIMVQSRSYIRHIANRDAEAIADLAQTPFFFGEQRFQSQQDVQAYFVRMFERAAEAQPQLTEMEVGPAMYRGILFSQWATQTTGLTNFNLAAAAHIDPRLRIYSSNEKDEPTGPPPTLDLSDGAARTDISFGASESEQFNSIHLYFSTDVETPRLRGVIMR